MLTATEALYGRELFSKMWLIMLHLETLGFCKLGIIKREGVKGIKESGRDMMGHIPRWIRKEVKKGRHSGLNELEVIMRLKKDCGRSQ